MGLITINFRFFLSIDSTNINIYIYMLQVMIAQSRDWLKRNLKIHKHKSKVMICKSLFNKQSVNAKLSVLTCICVNSVCVNLVMNTVFLCAGLVYVLVLITHNTINHETCCKYQTFAPTDNKQFKVLAAIG